jgi:hypothetical protein
VYDDKTDLMKIGCGDVGGIQGPSAGFCDYCNEFLAVLKIGISLPYV